MNQFEEGLFEGRCAGIEVGGECTVSLFHKAAVIGGNFFRRIVDFQHDADNAGRILDGKGRYGG